MKKCCLILCLTAALLGCNHTTRVQAPDIDEAQNQTTEPLNINVADLHVDYCENGYSFCELNRKQIDRLLALGQTTNMRNTSDMTPLMMVSDVETAKYLIDNGADVNARDQGGKTALMYASGRGKTDLVKFLIQSGADVNITDDQGRSALNISALDAEGFNALLDAGADPNVANQCGITALYRAPNAQTVKRLIEAGVDVNAPNKNCYNAVASQLGAVDSIAFTLNGRPKDYSPSDQCARTPLFYVHDAESAKLLLAAGADAKATDCEGTTVLMRNDLDAETFAILLDAGADPVAQSKFSWTPIHFAPDAQTVQRLVDAGAQINKTKANLNPLMQAAYLNRADVVQKLLELGTDAKEISPLSTSPIEYAGRLDIVKMLADAGADLEDALYYVDDAESMQYLISRNSFIKEDIEETDLTRSGDKRFVDGHDIYFWHSRPADVVKVLLDSGTRLYKSDIGWAAQNGDVDSLNAIFDYLKNSGISFISTSEALTDDERHALLDNKSLSIERKIEILSQKHHISTETAKVLCRLQVYESKDMDDLLIAALFASKDHKTVECIMNAASTFGSTEFIHKLNNSKKSIFYYVKDIESAQIMLDAGVDINTNSDRYNPILAAVNGILVDSPLPMHGGHRVYIDGYTQFLIDHGAVPHVQDKKGKTPWMLADHLDTILALLKAGADVNETDNHGQTKLMHTKRSEIAKLLIDNGADVNAKDNNGKTALHHVASLHNDGYYERESMITNLEIAKLLIASGADVNAANDEGLPPILAMPFESPDENETIYPLRSLLIDAGADLNVKTLDGVTPLMFAEPYTVQRMIDAGVNINDADNNGKTPLIYAAEHDIYNSNVVKDYQDGDEKIKKQLDYYYQYSLGLTVKALIDAGANVNASDINGDTALMKALDSKNPNTVKMLIDAGADLQAVNKDGDNILMLASKNGNLDLVKMLIERGVDLNIKNSLGNTALMLALDSAAQYKKTATAQSCRDVAKLLIQSGADIYVKNNDESTVLLQAVRANDKEIVEHLIQRGIDVNAGSPLWFAADKGNPDIVHMLLKAGANPNIQLKEESYHSENTPLLHQAIDNCQNPFNTNPYYCELVKELVKAGADINVLNKADFSGPIPPIYAIIKSINWAKRNTLYTEQKFDQLKSLLPFFIESGADLHFTDDDGYSLLTKTVSFHAENLSIHDLESAKLLIKAGLDVNAKDDNGKTALFYTLNAQDRQVQIDMELAEYLIQAGANTNVKNNDGDTLLDIVNRTLASRKQALSKSTDGRFIKSFSKDIESLNAFQTMLKKAGARPSKNKNKTK